MLYNPPPPSSRFLFCFCFVVVLVFGLFVASDFLTTICHLAILNVCVIIVLSIGNTQISIVLLCFLYLFVELMITMNEYSFFKPSNWIFTPSQPVLLYQGKPGKATRMFRKGQWGINYTECKTTVQACPGS